MQRRRGKTKTICRTIEKPCTIGVYFNWGRSGYKDVVHVVPDKSTNSCDAIRRIVDCALEQIVLPYQRVVCADSRRRATRRSGESYVLGRCAATITDVGWKGMRCSIAVEGDVSGLVADIRTHAGRSGSSLVVTPKEFKANGVVSLVVEEVDLAGTQAVIVVLDAQGALIT
jgi:hypothetical protein